MALPIPTRVMPFGEAAITRACALILAGEIVAVPTETVYGLAADATSSDAVARIYAAKQRPAFNPLIVHVADLDAARAIGRFDAAALELAQHHWPGPLTLVVPLVPEAPIASLVTAGLETIALRVPAHPAMRALLAACRRPLAAPSANRSGALSPTRAEHVVAGLEGRVPLVIDGGPCASGIESTIIAATGGPLRLLRPGPINVPQAIGFASDVIESPGQLVSHYAPAKPLRLDATERRSGEYWIGFGGIAGDVTLSPGGDPLEAAARLFDLLHLADRSPEPRIAVAPVPGEGIAAAIRDRLERAAAPRPA